MGNKLSGWSTDKGSTDSTDKGKKPEVQGRQRPKPLRKITDTTGQGSVSNSQASPAEMLGNIGVFGAGAHGGTREGRHIRFADTAKTTEKIGSDYEVGKDVSFFALITADESKLNDGAKSALKEIQRKVGAKELLLKKISNIANDDSVEGFELMDHKDKIEVEILNKWRELEKTADKATKEVMEEIIRVVSRSRPMGLPDKSKLR